MAENKLINDEETTMAPVLPNANASTMSVRKQRTKALLYLLALASAVLLSEQSFGLTRNQWLLASSTTSRYLPESKNPPKENTINQDEAIDPSTLFVPTLDFRIHGMSQYNPDYDFVAHVYCTEFAKDLTWEWWQQGDKPQQPQTNGTNFMRGSTSTRGKENDRQVQSTSRRLLIGVYAGYDEYAKLLEQSVWSARVYGQTWGGNVTVVTLQGTSFAPHGCKPDKSHATFNKIRLLFHAIDRRDEYDQVLLMDADAFVFNLDVDLTTLLNEEKHLVAAQQLPGAHEREAWNIHSGVTLWNLRHPFISSVALDWFEQAKEAVVQGTYIHDQQFLQNTLREHLEFQPRLNNEQRHERTTALDETLSECIVLNFRKHEFDYDNGTLVKHFCKESIVASHLPGRKDSSKDSNFIEDRLEKMEDAAKEVCKKHAEICAVVPLPQYDNS